MARCTYGDSLQIISSARAFVLDTVVCSHCKHRQIFKSRWACMHTVTSLKIAPAYGIPPIDWWIASHCRADQEIDTQLVNLPFIELCVQIRTLQVSFVLTGNRRTVQGLVV